jgi:hypothetical protein
VVGKTTGRYPDLYLAWEQVEVKIWTHKINGLTESDFILAAKCDVAFARMPRATKARVTGVPVRLKSEVAQAGEAVTGTGPRTAEDTGVVAGLTHRRARCRARRTGTDSGGQRQAPADHQVLATAPGEAKYQP